MPRVPYEAERLVQNACRVVCQQYPHLVKDLPVTRFNYAGRILAAELVEVREALAIAERFMSGFEGDEMQDGIDEKLAKIRSALEQKEWTL